MGLHSNVGGLVAQPVVEACYARREWRNFATAVGPEDPRDPVARCVLKIIAVGWPRQQLSIGGGGVTISVAEELALVAGGRRVDRIDLVPVAEIAQYDEARLGGCRLLA